MAVDASLAPAVPAARHKNLALVVLAATQLMVVLDAAITNVALPTIARELRMSQETLQWVVTGYTLTFGGFLMLGGRLADKLGRRKVFLAGMAVFSLASFLGGLAQNATWLVGARALQGLGGAILASTTLAIITATYREGAERNRAMGVFGAVAGSGGAIGVLLGGILTEFLGWQWVLFVNVPIGLVILAVAPRLLPESRSDDAPGFDLVGAVTITAALVSLVYAFVTAAEDGWGAGSTLGWFAASAVLLVGAVAIESRSRAPLVPLGVFRRRNITGANLTGLLVGAALFAMFFFLSLYLQQVLGYSALEAGLAYLPLSFGIIVSAGLASQLVTRLGARSIIVPGLLLSALGLLLFTRIDAGGTFLGDVLLPSVVVAAGLGLSFVPLVIAATAGATGKDAGLASGLINTAQQVGGSLGLAVLSTLAATRTESSLAGLGRAPAPADLAVAAVDGFRVAFTVGAGFALAGAAVAFVLVRVGREEAAAASEAGPVVA